MSAKYFAGFIIGLTLIVGSQANGGFCGAAPTNCPEKTCTASYTGPAPGGVVCSAFDNYAQCESFDIDGNTTETERVTCGGNGGASGGGGSSGGGGECAIYWWECDPWAF